MSHTLVFYRSDASTDPTPDKILALLDSLPHTHRTGDQGDYHFYYENKATGVDFSLEYRDPKLTREGGEEARDFHGLAPAGLTAQVDYLRPSFFGLESMPWLDHIRKELNLTILDPQSEGGSAQGPTGHSIETLFRSWDRGNTRATSTLCSQEGIEMATASRPVLQSWWRYMMALPDLEEHYGGNVDVPAPELVQDETGEVTTLVVWRFPDTVVIPENVEILFLDRDRRRFGLYNVQEKGTVMAEDFLSVVHSGILAVEEPHPHTLFAPERLSQSEEKAAERIPIDTRSLYNPVISTRLTDVVLPKKS